MIYGVGIDIVKISRINLKMSNKILGEKEKKIYDELKNLNRKREFLAGRFAAKEAFFKALRTSIDTITFKDIQVVYNERSGNPELLIHEKVQKHLEKMNISNSYISISHEKDYAIVVVILEK